MDGARSRIAAGAGAGAAFAAERWRDAWAPLFLLSAGQALTFVAGHADIQTTPAGRLQLAGWLLSALTLLPALGALYRSAVGGARRKEIGWGGLQFRQAEGAILSVLASGVVCLFLVLVAMVAVAGLARLPLRDAGVVHMPGLGPFALWFLCATPLLLAVAALGYCALNRLLLALPAAAADEGVRLSLAVHRSRRWPASLAATLALVELLPAALVIGVARALEALEHGWTQSAGLSAWPWPDAVIAGGVLSLLTAFVVLPLGVGARTHFYGRALAEARATQRRQSRFGPVLAPSEVEEPEAEVEPEPVPAPIPTEAEALAALAARLQAATDQIEAAAGARAQANGWSPPPLRPWRGAGVVHPLTAPVLLTHANDRAPDPRWWSAPEHPEDTPVA